MDWRQEAADKLLQYEARREALENIPQEIHRLELDYTTLRASVPSDIHVDGGKSADRREDAMLTNIIRRQELARQLDSAKVWVALVDKGLTVLTEDERLVLDRFYLHRRRGACERLCKELDRTRAQVYRRRDQALKHFTLALYGGLES